MMAAMVPLGFIGSVPVMGIALFVAGFAIAPTLIATMSLTEKVVPSARLTEGMAIMQTGVVAGVAPGRHHRRPGDRRRRRVAGVPRRGGSRPGRGPRRAVPAARPGCPARRGPGHYPRPVSPGSALQWSNWSGLESARPRRVSHPADTEGVVAAVERAREERHHREDGRHRPQLHRDLRARPHHAHPAAADRHRLRRPRRDDRHRPRRDPAEGAQRRAGEPRALPAQHGRHRRADPGRGGLDRHPRHRRDRGRAGRAAGRPRAGDRHRRGARAPPPTENPDVLEMARVGLGALGILTTRDVPGRAALPARGPRAADGVGRGAGHLRRAWPRPTTTSTCTGSRTPTGCSTKSNDRLDAELSEAEPLARLRGWLDDDFLSNTFFGALNTGGQPGRRRSSPA